MSGAARLLAGDIGGTKTILALFSAEDGDLKPGRYVLWCNLEGHYLGGMHASFEVQ